MASIFSLIGPAKIVAKVIEHRFPGSCKTLISELDKAQHDPHILRFRIKQIQDLWNEKKDCFSSSEVATIETNAGLDISDLDISDYSDAIDAMDTADTAVDVVVEGATSVLEWLSDIF